MTSTHAFPFAKHFNSLDEIVIPPGFIADPKQPHYLAQDGSIHFFVLQQDPDDERICPVCGSSVRCNGYETRMCQTLPIMRHPTFIHIRRRRYLCTHHQCKASSVRPSNGFKMFQHRSDELNLMIFAISVFCSDRATALICQYLGIKVEHDSVRRLLSHIHIEDNPDVEVVGIDDVALRKGRSYYTVVYDGETHHLLALLEGRGGATLKNWLKSHNKIKMIARDRAGAYAQAITEILPDCIQIADRFHLFKNMIDALQQIFMNELPAKFSIQKGEILDQTTEAKRELDDYTLSEDFIQLDYDNSPPLDENGNLISFIDTSRKRHEKIYVENEKKRIEKHKKIVKIREEYESGKTENEKDNRKLKRVLAERYGFCENSVKNYLEWSEKEVAEVLEIMKQKKKDVPINNYLNMIYKMLVDGIPAPFIRDYVIRQGYSGGRRSLKNYIAAIQKNNGIHTMSRLEFSQSAEERFPNRITEITRNEVLQYLTCKRKEKMAGTNVAKHYGTIKERYSVVEELENAWNSFYSALMGDNPDEMDHFCESYEGTILDSFAKSIKKDIAPIKNAISFRLNSGFVEGGNCKYKSVKRLMYGRAKQDHLFRKTYAQSIIARTGIDFRELLKRWLEKPYQWKTKKRHPKISPER